MRYVANHRDHCGRVERLRGAALDGTWIIAGDGRPPMQGSQGGPGGMMRGPNMGGHGSGMGGYGSTMMGGSTLRQRQAMMGGIPRRYRNLYRK